MTSTRVFGLFSQLFLFFGAWCLVLEKNVRAWSCLIGENSGASFREIDTLPRPLGREEKGGRNVRLETLMLEGVLGLPLCVCRRWEERVLVWLLRLRWGLGWRLDWRLCWGNLSDGGSRLIYVVFLSLISVWKIALFSIWGNVELIGCNYIKCFYLGEQTIHEILHSGILLENS